MYICVCVCVCVGGQHHTAAALPPGQTPYPLLGWVGRRAGLDGCGKSHLSTHALSCSCLLSALRYVLYFVDRPSYYILCK